MSQNSFLNRIIAQFCFFATMQLTCYGQALHVHDSTQSLDHEKVFVTDDQKTIIPQPFVRIFDEERFRDCLDANNNISYKRKRSERDRLFFYCKASSSMTKKLEIFVISPDNEIRFSRIRMHQGSTLIFDGTLKNDEDKKQSVSLTPGSTMGHFSVELKKEVWTDWKNALVSEKKDPGFSQRDFKKTSIALQFMFIQKSV